MDLPQPLSVSELTRQVKDIIDGNFPDVCVVGEISNCTQAASGHVYLTLKDNKSQLRAVMWKTRAERLKFDLHDGLEVIATGPLEVYQARGSFQMMIHQMYPQGMGALELAFRQLQEKLSVEGLFDPERKRALPALPRRIALVTSPTSAAVRDMLQVMSRRWPGLDVVIVPVPVQGAGAAELIAVGIESAAKIPEVDLIITGRGGGSLEDLWAFNEEVVARAIVNSPIPVISAVGHEIDVTIADLVADRRALTPSEAAELAVPSMADFQSNLNSYQQRLVQSLRDKASHSRVTLESVASRRVFTNPYDRILEFRHSLDDTTARLSRGARSQLERASQKLARFSGSLDALSPLKVLGRGYSITRDKKTGAILRSVNDVRSEMEIVTRLADGDVESSVKKL